MPPLLSSGHSVQRQLHSLSAVTCANTRGDEEREREAAEQAEENPDGRHDYSLKILFAPLSQTTEMSPVFGKTGRPVAVSM